MVGTVVETDIRLQKFLYCNYGEYFKSDFVVFISTWTRKHVLGAPLVIYVIAENRRQEGKVH